MYHATVINLTSSRSVGMRDIKTFLTTPISRIKTLRDDEGRKDEVSYIGKQAAGAPRQQPSGMTTYLNNTPLPRFAVLSPQGGQRTAYGFTARSVIPTLRAATNAGYSGCSAFTLIELLVVILIIAVLAAIALPQYQKAVWKSRIVEVKMQAQSLAKAQQLYYLTNGVYAVSFSQLDFSFNNLFKITTTDTPIVSSSDAIRGTEYTELFINSNQGNYIASRAQFRKGIYKGSGFSFTHRADVLPQSTNRFWCTELTTQVKTEGSFCREIMGITNTPITQLQLRWYAMP